MLPDSEVVNSISLCRLNEWWAVQSDGLNCLDWCWADCLETSQSATGFSAGGGGGGCSRAN